MYLYMRSSAFERFYLPSRKFSAEKTKLTLNLYYKNKSAAILAAV